MLAANYLPNASGNSAGVGEIDAGVASTFDDPPNPNENLNAFVGPDSTTGQLMFDQASWSQTAQAEASWSQASWSQAIWQSASWSQASWSQASWSQASWSQNLGSAMQTLASWSQSSLAE